MRTATLSRTTNETDISVSLSLDGTGRVDVSTGVGFFDHMLAQLGRHGLFDLTLKAKGDLHIDHHHTVEDAGIALGQAFAQALGDKRGIVRYGHALVPLDEALAQVVVDVSGRPFIAFDLPVEAKKIGDFDSELVVEWFRAFAVNAGFTLHVTRLAGVNGHHIVESAFKALARALRDAVAIDPREAGRVPSTKGAL